MPGKRRVSRGVSPYSGHSVVVVGWWVVVTLVPVVDWLLRVCVGLRVVHFVRARCALDGYCSGVSVRVVA